MRNARLWVCIFVLLPTACYGQSEIAHCAKVGVGTAILNQKGTAITIRLALPVDPKSETWALYDEIAQTVLPIGPPKYDLPDTYSKPSSLMLSLETPIDRTHAYIVSVVNLQPVGCPVSKVPLTAKLDMTRQEPKSFSLTPSQGRSDSDLYLSGLLQGAQGSKASYTADVKFQMPWVLRDASLGTGRPYQPEIDFVPMFDFTGSTNAKADGNSVTVGTLFWLILPTDPVKHPALNAAISSLISKPGFVLESDRRFEDLNTIFSFRNYFVLRSFGTRLQFVPLASIGLEAGNNIRAPQVNLYKRGIVRPDIGMHVYLNLYSKNYSRVLAFLESDYVRRWPVEPEPIFTQDSAGNLRLASVGTSPRDYVTTKFEFDFNKYFGITLGHTYGELPPLYTKISNQYSLGLVLKSGLKYKPK